MKLLPNKYTYPLVIAAIVASAGLQVAWLWQLYQATQIQVKRDLEQTVSNAAQMSNYLSLVPGHEKSENFRNFFLSPEWIQFKQAYTNMHFNHVGSRFISDIKGDSTIVDISLRIANEKTGKHGGKNVYMYDKGETKESVAAADRNDQRRMDSLVRRNLQQSDLDVHASFTLYNFADQSKPFVVKSARHAAYYSQQYSYNLSFLYTYQLIVPSINRTVIYRMRFYLVSSLLMIVLTIGAFYFVFRLMQTQRLYAQARISFTSNMTHELKTPVAIMEVALDSITRYHEPDKLEKYINISKNELQRLSQLIEKVLNLDQLDNGQVMLRPELYDIQQGLEQVVAAMQLQNSSSGSEIVYNPANDPCFVSGDPVHLTNVFYNLIDNALKYSGSGAKIIVSCYSNEDHVRVSIKDNGPGIAKMYQSKVFERFFRIQDNENIHTVKGSGLGLYYVKQIVEKHGGQIKIVSEPVKGTDFMIDLPAYNEI